MEENLIKNSLIGTFYEKNNFYISLYDLNKNTIQKQLISDLKFPKEKENNLNIINRNENINNKAFCFDCKKNIDFNVNSECKCHNIKYLNDFINDINIKEIEENLKLAVENYKKVYKMIENKLNEFKKRNENQIILARKIIKMYYSKSNNLNYQIISNTKNLLRFNQIKLGDFEGYNFKYVFEANILKEYSLNNYIIEKIRIKNIQKNCEIKTNNNINIRDIIILNKQSKIIFNSGITLFLLNNRNYSLEDKKEIDKDILSMNLIKEKEEEMILISFENSIKKIKIENNKIDIVDFLNNIEILKPGIVIKYQEEYAWTYGKYIKFSFNQDFNSENNFAEESFNYENEYYFKIINLIKFYDDILFVLSLKKRYHSFSTYKILLGSCKNPLAFNNFLELEEFHYCDERLNFSFEDFQDDINTGKHYNIYLFNSKNIIISGQLGIYVINTFNWEIKKEIILKDKLIESAFYLRNSKFLIFFKENPYIKEFYKNESEKSALLCDNNDKNNLLIVRIGENYSQIIFETFVNCKGKKIYYDSNINSNIDNEINSVCGFISFLNNISLYQFIDIQKKIEMKNN